MPRLPERLWGLPVLPVTLQARRAFQGRLLFYACAAFLLFLALRPGEWGDKATIVQAFTAVVLIWATYQSIRRSDDQVEAAQSQIKIAQEQLEAAQKAGEAHHLSCLLRNRTTLTLANLSTLPIQIERVTEYIRIYDGATEHNLVSGRILKSGEIATITLLALASEDAVREAREYAGIIAGGEYVDYEGKPLVDPLEKHGIDIVYRYGGTGGRNYTKVYGIGVYANTSSNNTSSDWPFVYFMYLTEFYYSFITGTTDNGKYHRIDVPDEEIVLRSR